MEDKRLAFCLEGLRRANLYLHDILLHREKPRKYRTLITTAVDGYVAALKAIIDNCDLPEHLESAIRDKIRQAEESPATTVASYVITSYDRSLLDDVFREIERSLGFDPDEYARLYVP